MCADHKECRDGDAIHGEGDVDLDIGSDVAVPDSFPADLPLPDGTLVASVAMDQGWQLSDEIDDKAEAESVAAHFAADGAFEETVNSAMGGIQTWTHTGDLLGYGELQRYRKQAVRDHGPMSVSAPRSNGG